MGAATGEITDVSEVGPETVAVSLTAPTSFDPQPGQFVKLSATIDDTHVSRFFTISSPDAAETFEVTVAVDPDGTLGPWLATATGETVEIEGPYGRAYYDGHPASLIIAGGPGIGPAVGIGERALTDGNDVTIIYQATKPAHTDRLADIEERGATVVITNESLTTPVSAAYTDDAQVFIYGFEAFVTAAIEALETAGGSTDDAMIENFG